MRETPDGVRIARKFPLTASIAIKPPHFRDLRGFNHLVESDLWWYRARNEFGSMVVTQRGS